MSIRIITSIIIVKTYFQVKKYKAYETQLFYIITNQRRHKDSKDSEKHND